MILSRLKKTDRGYDELENDLRKENQLTQRKQGTSEGISIVFKQVCD